jgi:hypothetical protein
VEPEQLAQLERRHLVHVVVPEEGLERPDSNCWTYFSITTFQKDAVSPYAVPLEQHLARSVRPARSPLVRHDLRCAEEVEGLFCAPEREPGPVGSVSGRGSM